MSKIFVVVMLSACFIDARAQSNKDKTPPTVKSINRQSPTSSTTNATSVIFKVTFSEKVNGVDATDFTATVLSGTLSATVASITVVNSSTYSVTVNSISGNGVLRLDLKVSGTGITDLAGNAISGGYTEGQTYTIDQTPPTISSINRQLPTGSTTNATAVIFEVTFSESVNGVDVTDFTATVVSGTLSVTVASVTAVNSSIYSVTVNSIGGNGVLRLDLKVSGTGINDLAGNAISSGGYTKGQTYNIDQTPPTVSSITRQSPISQSTTATSVVYRTVFSEPVNGVDATDFSLTVMSGSVSGSVTSVTAVGTTNTTYDVNVSSISGSGELRLDLNATGTSIVDAVGNSISGGYTGGETYIVGLVDQTPPTVSSVNRQSPISSPTNAASVTFEVTFSESVNGVDVTDFTATVVSGTLSATVTSVTAVNSSTYSVTVNSISGDGVLRLDLNASGTGITDLAGNAISGGYTAGQTYTIDQTPPKVTSITRQLPTTQNTTSASVVYRAVFSESVTGVDVTDFGLTVVSGTVSGSVSSVAAVGTDGTTYDINVGYLSGSGDIRLDLNAANTGIADAAGNAISGGYTNGELYTIVNTSPTTLSGFTSVTYLNPVPISSHTGYEQQAKVWTYAGYWWAVMATTNGTKIFRLDGTNWTDILTIATSTNSKVDCKIVENVTHILLFRGASSNSYLVSVEYDASTNTYKLWSKRSSRVTINFESGAQTATLDLDGTGRMWVASDAVSNINVRWSDYPYSTWSAPIAIASGITDDDACAIVALKNASKIGVLWSNQNTKRWGFKTHIDATDPAVWSADEVPASQSALDIKHGFADNHMDIVPASDGTLYCAIKTGYDTPDYPKIALLVRRPSGTWDDVYPVTTYPVGTRPIVMVNEAKGKLKVLYTSTEGGGDILYKEALLSDLTTFSQEFTLFTGNYNFLTSTHQTYDPNIAVIVTDQSTTPINAAGFLGSDDPLASTSIASSGASRPLSKDTAVNHGNDLQANLIAYPNPFSTNAIITFTLPYAGAYTVALYNINGVKVSVLKQGRAEAGKLNIVYVDGSKLNNELYFVKVQVGAKSKTLKLVHQK